MTEPDAATAHAWAALGGPPELVERVAWTGTPGLDAVLPVRELARATVGAASLAAAELLAQRTGHAMPEVRVDEGAVAVAFTSERHLRVDGRPIPLFAPPHIRIHRHFDPRGHQTFFFSPPSSFPTAP